MSEANYVNGAAGTIAPAVFVVQDTTNPKAVNQASGTSAFIIGVSQNYANTAPITGAALNAATNLGDPICVYQEGEIALLNATSAGWTAGDRLSSNASGFGVTASGSQYYGAIALTTMSGVGFGQVQVLVGKNP